MNRWPQIRAKNLFFKALQDLNGGVLEVACPEETYAFGDPTASLRAMAVIHDESLGLHYAKTLAIWRQRFFQNLQDVQRLGFDERFQRMWDFYLGWCEGAFRERYINVAQLLLAKNGTQRLLLGDPSFSTKSLPSGSVSA